MIKRNGGRKCVCLFVTHVDLTPKRQIIIIIKKRENKERAISKHDEANCHPYYILKIKINVIE
jgi:hypothetical protein